MPGRQQTNFFKIGVFIVIGIALIIAAVMAFGAFHVFERRVSVETYFNESIQGLSVGSPVKYRGIKIGQVKKINFVSNVYNLSNGSNKYSHYVYVLMSIDPDFMSHLPENRLPQFFSTSVHKGLRVKLAMLDLTGNAYLELNYIPTAQQTPKLPMDWTPKNIYIPSTTSILSRFTDSIQSILQGLQSVNFKKFFSNIQDVANSTNKAMNRISDVLKKSQTSIISTMKNVDGVSGNLRDLTQELKENPSSVLFNKPQPIDPSKL